MFWDAEGQFSVTMLAYMTMIGLDSTQIEVLIARQTSVNDLVRDQLQTLMSSPKLSSNDQQRLQLYFDSPCVRASGHVPQLFRLGLPRWAWITA